jgi:hypothetical protein
MATREEKSGVRNAQTSFHLQVAYKAKWHEIGGDAPQFAEGPPA